MNSLMYYKKAYKLKEKYQFKLDDLDEAEFYYNMS